MSNPSLLALNSATLGTNMPEVTLADGSIVQTGTMAALLANIRSYNEAYAAQDTARMTQFEADMASVLPLLRKVGLFELFPPEQWLQGSNEGKKLIGKLALAS